MHPLRMTKRDDVIAKMITGERIGGFALTEPEAGSDVASMRTTRAQEAGSWILDGEKTLISNVGIAHHFVVFAKVGRLRRKPSARFSFPPTRKASSSFAFALSGHHPLGRIVLSSCRVPESALLGNVGQGLSLALGTLEVFRTSVGAAANGMAWRALEEAIAHVTKRVQFEKKLSELQLVQAALAEMTTELHASRLLVASAAWHADAHATMSEEARRRENGRRVSMAKMQATESAQRIIDRAVQLHGGLGVVLGSKVEELYREIRPLRIYEGATDVLKLIIASSIYDEGFALMPPAVLSARVARRRHAAESHRASRDGHAPLGRGWIRQRRYTCKIHAFFEGRHWARRARGDGGASIEVRSAPSHLRRRVRSGPLRSREAMSRRGSRKSLSADHPFLEDLALGLEADRRHALARGHRRDRRCVRARGGARAAMRVRRRRAPHGARVHAVVVSLAHERAARRVRRLARESLAASDARHRARARKSRR